MLLHRSYAVVDDVYFYLWTGHGMNCNSVVLANKLPGTQPHTHILVDRGIHGQGYDRAHILDSSLLRPSNLIAQGILYWAVHPVARNAIVVVELDLIGVSDRLGGIVLWALLNLVAAQIHTGL